MIYMGSPRASKAFTIVELVVVIVVIGILAAITIISYNVVTENAVRQQIATDLQGEGAALTKYRAEHGAYPSDLSSLTSTPASESSFQYTYNEVDDSYCLTADQGDYSSYMQSGSSEVLEGACEGHAVNGVYIITNMSINPSYESDSTVIYGYNGNTSRITTGGYAGSAFIRTTRTDAGAEWGPWWNGAGGVDEGSTYYVSLWARSNVPVAKTLSAEWYTDDTFDIRIAIPTASSVIDTKTIGTSWTQIGGTVTVPAQQTPVTAMRLTLYSTVSGSTSDYVDTDAVMIVAGSEGPYVYADGNTQDWSWNGAEDMSSSTGPRQ